MISACTLAGQGYETPWVPVPIFVPWCFLCHWVAWNKPQGIETGLFSSSFFCSPGQQFSPFGVTRVQLACFLKMLVTVPPEILIQYIWVGKFNKHPGASRQIELWPYVEKPSSCEFWMVRVRVRVRVRFRPFCPSSFKWYCSSIFPFRLPPKGKKTWLWLQHLAFSRMISWEKAFWFRSRFKLSLSCQKQLKRKECLNVALNFLSRNLEEKEVHVHGVCICKERVWNDLHWTTILSVYPWAVVLGWTRQH